MNDCCIAFCFLIFWRCINSFLYQEMILWLFLQWKYEIRTTSFLIYVRFRSIFIDLSAIWILFLFPNFPQKIHYIYCIKILAFCKQEKNRKNTSKSILHLIHFVKPPLFLHVPFVGSFRCFRHRINGICINMYSNWQGSKDIEQKNTARLSPKIKDSKFTIILIDFWEQKSQNNRNDKWEFQNILFAWRLHLDVWTDMKIIVRKWYLSK